MSGDEQPSIPIAQSRSLIAQPKANPEDDPDKDLKGAGLGDSIEDLKKDLQDGKENWQIGIDIASVGLDFLAIAMNPLGELVKAGVGWLMENLSFLREPLEVLAGDPAKIEALAQSWNNIAGELHAASGDYLAALSSVSGWAGDSAEKYRELATSYAKSLDHTAERADSVADWVTTIGIVVATARAIIFDIIASFISKVITKAIIAVASSWCTFGASVGVFVTSVVIDAIQLWSRIQKRISKLLSTIQQLTAKLKILGDKTSSAAQALGRKSTEIGTAANKAAASAEQMRDSLSPLARTFSDTPFGKAAREQAVDSLDKLPRAAAKYDDYISGRNTSSIAERLGPKSTLDDIVSSGATRAAKETAKAAKDQADQYSGGSQEDGKARGE